MENKFPGKDITLEDLKTKSVSEDAALERITSKSDDSIQKQMVEEFEEIKLSVNNV